MHFAQNFESNPMPQTKSAQIPYSATYFFENLEVGGRAVAHKLLMWGSMPIAHYAYCHLGHLAYSLRKQPLPPLVLIKQGQTSARNIKYIIYIYIYIIV